MTTRLSIGDFSRMTYLSVKALRHYHDIGVLEPVEVDPSSGYRFYAPSQVGVAQMIRRLRELGLPLDDVRTVVQAPDARSRDAALVAHLRRMERQLQDTQQTVRSLRSLLEEPRDDARVQRRHIPAAPALVVAERVSADDVMAWWTDVFTVLHRALARSGGARSGPDGALFPQQFFEEEVGDLVAFLPVTGGLPDARSLPSRVVIAEIPATEAAVLVHDGPFGDLDRTYGVLGTWVLERVAGASGPIREYYLPTGDPGDLLAHVTEVCWPVTTAQR